MQEELATNRRWLSPWEATNPDGAVPLDMRISVRRLLQQYRDGSGVPFVMELGGEVAGQLNVWGIARGSLSTATIGYWVSERFAGHGVTPTSVALATDMCFERLRLHRVEICIRPENKPSLPRRREAWVRLRATGRSTSTSTARGATTTPSP